MGIVYLHLFFFFFFIMGDIFCDFLIVSLCNKTRSKMDLLLLKERNCSSWIKFFSLIAGPTEKGDKPEKD